MPLNVTSWWIDQARKTASAPQRRLTIGGTDYSEQVLRWPELSYRDSAVDLGGANVTLANHQRDFQFFVDCDVHLVTSVGIELGWTHPQSGTEYASLFAGQPTTLNFEEHGRVLRLSLAGKTRKLMDDRMGSEVESEGLDFTTSAHHPADLAWTLVTCYGRLSSVQSTSNPDVDYALWQEWQEQDIIRDLRVKSYLTGQKVAEVLDVLATMSSRLANVQGDRLRFTDLFQPWSEAHDVLRHEAIIGASLELDAQDITTLFFAEANYTVNDRKYSVSATRVNSAAEADFGRRSGRFSSAYVWFNSQDDAQYLAEDRVRREHRPQPVLSLEATLAGGVQYRVGEVYTLTDSFLGIDSEDFRVTEQHIGLDQGAVSLRLVPAQHRPWEFFRTVQSDTNMEARTITAVGCDVFIGLANAGLNTHRAYRTDGEGLFVSLDYWASALAKGADNLLIFGGIPNSGDANGGVQRSTDAGSSTTVITTYAALGTYAVHEVKSGTWLIGIGCGGLLRSTDAGSSWSLTTAFSHGYAAHAFAEARPDVLWALVVRYSIFGAGIKIWESGDAGASWSPKHIVETSDAWNGRGIHVLNDSESLVGYDAAGGGFGVVKRSDFQSVDSIGWVRVNSVAFAHVVETSSGHLLYGAEEDTNEGGQVWRSTDAGSSWTKDTQIAKQGDLGLIDNGNGTVDAFAHRTAPGNDRSYRYRNYRPNEDYF